MPIISNLPVILRDIEKDGNRKREGEGEARKGKKPFRPAWIVFTTYVMRSEASTKSVCVYHTLSYAQLIS